MAYYCHYNPPDGYDYMGAPAANYFSNPDVSYLGEIRWLLSLFFESATEHPCC